MATTCRKEIVIVRREVKRGGNQKKKSIVGDRQSTMEKSRHSEEK